MANSLNEKLTNILEQKQNYIIPENLKPGVTVFGITSNMQNYETLNIIPSTSQQTYNSGYVEEINISPVALQEKTTSVSGVVVPDSDYVGLSKVTVNVSQDIPKYHIHIPGLISDVNYTNRSTEYGFSLNGSGYYESNNQGQDDTYAVMRVSFVSKGNGVITVKYINYGESNFDFGTISKVDHELTLSSSEDSSENYALLLKGQQSPDVKTYVFEDIPAGTHFIDFKYKKDSSVGSDNDSLQFKIEYEADIEMDCYGIVYSSVEAMEADTLAENGAIGVIFDTTIEKIYIKMKNEWQYWGVINTSDATAKSDNVLNGKTFYAGGEKITGSMTNYGDMNLVAQFNAIDYDAGYFNTLHIRGIDSTIEPNLTPSNVVEGVTILGIEGIRSVSDIDLGDYFDIAIVQDNVSTPSTRFTDLIRKAPPLSTSVMYNGHSLFANGGSITSVSNFDTNNCEIFSYMFANSYNLTDIPNISTSHARAFDYMFYNCKNLVNIPDLDFGYACTNRGTVDYDKLTLNSTINYYYAYNSNDTNNIPSASYNAINRRDNYSFYYAEQNRIINEAKEQYNVYTSQIYSSNTLQNTFVGCESLVHLPNITNISFHSITVNVKTINVTPTNTYNEARRTEYYVNTINQSMAKPLFSRCYNLVDVDNFPWENFSSVTNYRIYGNVKSFSYIPSSMFYEARSLNHLPSDFFKYNNSFVFGQSALVNCLDLTLDINYMYAEENNCIINCPKIKNINYLFIDNRYGYIISPLRNMELDTLNTIVFNNFRTNFSSGSHSVGTNIVFSGVNINSVTDMYESMYINCDGWQYGYGQNYDYLALNYKYFSSASISNVKSIYSDIIYMNNYNNNGSSYSPDPYYYEEQTQNVWNSTTENRWDGLLINNLNTLYINYVEVYKKNETFDTVYSRYRYVWDELRLGFPKLSYPDVKSINYINLTIFNFWSTLNDINNSPTDAWINAMNVNNTSYNSTKAVNVYWNFTSLFSTMHNLEDIGSIQINDSMATMFKSGAPRIPYNSSFVRSNVYASGMLSNCPNITANGVNNILVFFNSLATSYSGSGYSFNGIGISQDMYNNISSLPIVSTLMSKGWTTGY